MERHDPTGSARRCGKCSLLLLVWTTGTHTQVREFKGRRSDFTAEMSVGLLSLGWVARHRAWQGADRNITEVANISTERGGSKTARSVSNMRFIGHKLGFGPDSLAGAFDFNRTIEFTKYARDVVRTFRERGDMFSGTLHEKRRQQQSRPGSNIDKVGFLQVRTCFMDDVLAQWVELFPEGCNVVLLGAGYDTRFHRLALPNNVGCFEVDGAGTQRAKIKQLATAQLVGAERVQYTEVDFQKQSWLDKLKSEGFTTNLPTVIIWEGVTYYMPEPAVLDTLAMVAEDFEVPCIISFDYPSEDALEDHRRRMHNIGEPWLFGAEPQRMERLLQGFNLTILDHVSVATGLQRYLPTLPDGSSVGVGSSHKAFVVAGNLACLKSKPIAQLLAQK